MWFMALGCGKCRRTMVKVAVTGSDVTFLGMDDGTDRHFEAEITLAPVPPPGWKRPKDDNVARHAFNLYWRGRAISAEHRPTSTALQCPMCRSEHRVTYQRLVDAAATRTRRLHLD